MDLLPLGVPWDSYVQCTEAVCSVSPNIRVALDTSDGPLTKVVRTFLRMWPFLTRSDAYEFGQIIGQDGGVLEATAAEGNYLPVAQTVRALNELSVPEVPATLGGVRAVLSVKSGDCFAVTSPSIVAQSTVGTGNCALAGYVVSRERGDSYRDALAMAAAYEAAATSLPGTAIPCPEQVHPEAGRLWQLDAWLSDA